MEWGLLREVAHSLKGRTSKLLQRMGLAQDYELASTEDDAVESEDVDVKEERLKLQAGGCLSFLVLWSSRPSALVS